MSSTDVLFVMIAQLDNYLYYDDVKLMLNQ